MRCGVFSPSARWSDDVRVDIAACTQNCSCASSTGIAMRRFGFDRGGRGRKTDLPRWCPWGRRPRHRPPLPPPPLPPPPRRPWSPRRGSPPADMVSGCPVALQLHKIAAAACVIEAVREPQRAVFLLRTTATICAESSSLFFFFFSHLFGGRSLGLDGGPRHGGLGEVGDGVPDTHCGRGCAAHSMA